MKRLMVLLCAVLLAGCATAPRPPLPDKLFNDALFVPPAERIDMRDVFALSEDMRRHVREQIAPAVRSKGAVHALLDALYSKGDLRLEYDSSVTRNAREAFQERSGNCLSLVIMTAAFARELGVEVRFHSVAVDEAWDRSGDLFFFVGHVNLALSTRLAPSWNSGGSQEWQTVDFLPGQDVLRQKRQVIEESRVLAMYMNNKAAEALARGRLDDAYAWIRVAIAEDPDFVNAYNTLGVIYQRRSALDEAERALRYALQVAPRNAHVMGNLLQVLQRQGRMAEAEQLAAQLQRLQPTAPFAQFKQGLQAMRDGDFRKAKRLFEKELDRADFHEFHFWLAMAHLQLGEVEPARRHLAQALEASTTRDQHALYTAKLQRLKSPTTPTTQ